MELMNRKIIGKSYVILQDYYILNPIFFKIAKSLENSKCA